ncbi:MAG: DUF4380 domain-containing protein [Ignavibacteriaceae bacterium]
MKNHSLQILLPCLFYFIMVNAITQAQNKSITTTKNGSYIINTGNKNMTFDPKEGGRITSFKLDDYEFLTDKNVHPDNYGSTFWPSPQSNWNWPPPAVLDNEPYQVEYKGKSIVATSGIDPVSGLQFIKEFSGGKNNRMYLTYSILNVYKEVKKVAPWEVTRVHKGGLLFFPAGETPVHKKSFDMALTETMNGIVWSKIEKQGPKSSLLSISDGSEGWIAYAIEGKLFVKKFEDIKPAMFAPGEAEISLYLCPDADYIEIEIQGKYESLNPGSKSVWKVEWNAANIPSTIKVDKDSKELVDFVRGLIK